MPRLPPAAELDWSDAGAPRATAFGDVYYSREGGLAEAEAVFLRGCDLPQAWEGQARFSICELGFGTGLNVLALWRAWKATRNPHAVLHIASVEAFPIAQADAARALGAFPEIADLAAKLLLRWPVRAYGPQRLWFPEDGLALTLHIGEAGAVLEQMHARFDAWFLDGFAPARNPAMWTPALFRRIAALSAPGARLASFSVAGEVRRNLQAVGFRLVKQPGFGAKRERLEAIYDASAPCAQPLYPYAPCFPKRVAIIGAGIAGASIAAALARRDVETIVLDAAPALGAGASGNPAGLVMPRLDRGGALSELFLAAYIDAVETYAALGVFTRCGVDQRAGPWGGAALADLLADPPLPEAWLSKLPDGAALHARAGLVRPLAAIAAMLKGARLLCDAPVGALEQAEAGWVLRAPDGRALLKAGAVVLACGAALKSFAPARFLPLEISRGQIEWGALTCAMPAHALIQGTYVAPFENGVLFGATFDQIHGPPAVHESRARNLAALTRLEPELAASIDPETLTSRASLRAGAPDFAPIVGLMPDAAKWSAQNAGLKHGLKPDPALPAPALDGVYVLGGLGARGLTLAPLLGERIAAEMCGEPQALSQAALDAIHPARFLHRALKRGG